MLPTCGSSVEARSSLSSSRCPSPWNPLGMQWDTLAHIGVPARWHSNAVAPMPTVCVVYHCSIILLMWRCSFPRVIVVHRKWVCRDRTLLHSTIADQWCPSVQLAIDFLQIECSPGLLAIVSHVLCIYTVHLSTCILARVRTR